ncbi:MAG: hypothetical protein JWO58_239 [Chitinophagaceae bacterium]|nr:hypothetical protein [Chitinophagaceae bacterium]
MLTTQTMKKQISLLMLLLSAGLFQQAHATNYTVQYATDAGTQSLRTHITSANADLTATASNPHIIHFDMAAGQTILLTSALPAINNHIIIQGQAQLVTVSGNNSYNVFTVNSGYTVQINSLIITGAKISNNGGGVMNSGTLSMDGVIITGNNVSGTAQGAGVYNASGASLTITNSTIDHNVASGMGGGIASFAGMTLTNCTLYANSSTTNGGGIANNFMGFINSCTIANNSGGGIYTIVNINTAVLKNTICVNNTGNEDIYTNGTGSVSADYSIYGTLGATASISGSNNTAGSTYADLFGTNTFMLYGTSAYLQTINLKSGSPAIDAANSSAPATDELGVSRTNAADIGAMEYYGTVTAITNSLSQDLVTIYSNPGNGLFQAEIDNGIQGDYDWKVMDNNGRLLLTSGALTKGNDVQMQTINLINQVQGTYLLIFSNGKGTLTKRLIKL